jgi:hypothetical protein
MGVPSLNPPLRPEANEPPPQSALMLTQQEWDDLTVMVSYYSIKTLEGGPHGTNPRSRTEIQRRVALAERIIEANQP